MKELTAMLNGIEDSYYDFVSAIVHYAKKHVSRQEALHRFLSENPDAKSADVIRFVSEQSDFSEDAAYMNVG